MVRPLLLAGAYMLAQGAYLVLPNKAFSATTGLELAVGSWAVAAYLIVIAARNWTFRRSVE